MRRFKKEKWQSAILTNKLIDVDLPTDSRVYLVVVFKNGEMERNIVYVGSSNCLYGRIYNHNVVGLLRKNLNGYSIEIWHKDFGNRRSNSYKERQLIMELKPIFNMEWRAIETYKIDTSLFWKSVGVDKVITKKITKRQFNHLALTKQNT